VGANGPRGGSDNQGGTNGSDSDDEGDVVITRGGCSLASATDHSPLAALFVALAALLRFARRRGSKSGTKLA
jgi:MYXO-CTERM domain-containing protein